MHFLMMRCEYRKSALQFVMIMSSKVSKYSFGLYIISSAFVVSIKSNDRI